MSPASARRKGAAPARKAALQALMQAFDPSAPGLDVLLEEAARQQRLDGRDLGLARELALGVARRRRLLESILSQFLKKPLKKSGPAAAVHLALLMGIYQHLCMTSIPPHTIVHETVELAGDAVRGGPLRGLANAVMRRVVEAEELTAGLPGRGANWPLWESFPPWLVEEAERAFPGQAPEFARACNEPAPLCLRGTALWQGTAGELQARVLEEARALDPESAISPGLLPGGFRLAGHGLNPARLPAFSQGLITAEDDAAQAAASLAGARPGMQVLDWCAAPGGKTAHLADDAGRQLARLVACDVSPRRLALLRSTLDRLKVRAEVHLLDDFLRSPPPPGGFDLVLVDAPCTGLGTLRRHPEIRWRRGSDAIEKMAALQLQILQAALAHVAPGGVLHYSVCTISRAECEGVREEFLRENGDRVQPAPAPDGPTGLGQRRACGEGQWRFAPHWGDGDGFYVARFRRRAEAGTAGTPQG